MGFEPGGLFCDANEQKQKERSPGFEPGAWLSRPAVARLRRRFRAHCFDQAIAPVMYLYFGIMLRPLWYYRGSQLASGSALR